MSNETTWLKGTGSTGKYPKKAFSGILVAAYPSENNNGTKLLQLDFENEVQVGIYGIGKAKISADEVTVAGSLAEFQNSLEPLGIECFWGIEGNEILGFKTEPDIIGAKLWMEPLEEQVVGDDTQTKKSLFWGTVKKIERIATTPAAKKPGKLPAKPPIPIPTPETQEPTPVHAELVDDVMKSLTEPKPNSKSVMELFTGFGKVYKVSEITATLKHMEGDGIMAEKDKKWYVI